MACHHTVPLSGPVQPSCTPCKRLSVLHSQVETPDACRTTAVISINVRLNRLPRARSMDSWDMTYGTLKLDEETFNDDFHVFGLYWDDKQMVRVLKKHYDKVVENLRKATMGQRDREALCTAHTVQSRAGVGGTVAEAFRPLVVTTVVGIAPRLGRGQLCSLQAAEIREACQTRGVQHQNLVQKNTPNKHVSPYLVPSQKSCTASAIVQTP